MIMLKAVILVCALTGPCNTDTAVDVIQTPVLSALPGRCLMLGQAYLAGNEIGRDIEGRRVIVACRRA